MHSFFSGKTIVVTGAAGFIGSHLCDALLNQEAKVIGVDNLLTGNKTNLSQALKNPAFTFIEADVIQPTSKYLKDLVQVDAIFHFASPASPPIYQRYPVETYQVNSLGTHLLLTYLKENFSHARFVYASTSEVYGDPAIHPQPETYWGNVNPNGVRACYDEGKRLGETICGVFERDFNLDVRIVRIFNTYGPRIDLDDGRVIPNFIKEALAKKDYTIYGDGSQTRSYCFVSDLVEGILRLGGFDNLKGQTINLGNPGEFTILQTAHELHKVVTANEQLELAEIPTSYHDLPKDDPTRRKPDISKAQSVLDWSPVVPFWDGLKKTWDFFADN